MQQRIDKVILERNIPLCWDMKMDEPIGAGPMRFSFFPKWVLSREAIKPVEIPAPEALATFMPHDLDFSLQVRGEVIIETGTPSVRDVSVIQAVLVFRAGEWDVARVPADHLTAGWEDYLISEVLSPDRSKFFHNVIDN